MQRDGDAWSLGEELICFELVGRWSWRASEKCIFVDPLHLVVCTEEEFVGVELDTLKVHRHKIAFDGAQSVTWRADKGCFQLFTIPLAGRWSYVLVGENYPQPVPFPAWEDDVKLTTLEWVGKEGGMVVASDVGLNASTVVYDTATDPPTRVTVHALQLLSVEPMEGQYWLGITPARNCYEVSRGVGEEREVVWRKQVDPPESLCGALRLNDKGALECFVVEARGEERVELMLYSDVLARPQDPGRVLVRAGRDDMRSFAVHPRQPWVLYHVSQGASSAMLLNWETQQTIKLGSSINIDANWRSIGWSRDGRYCFGTQSGTKPFYLASRQQLHLKRFSPSLGVREERASEEIVCMRQVGARLLVSLEGPSRQPWNVPTQSSQLRFYLESDDDGDDVSSPSHWSVVCVLDVGNGATSFVMTKDVLLISYADGSFLRLPPPLDLQPL